MNANSTRQAGLVIDMMSTAFGPGEHMQRLRSGEASVLRKDLRMSLSYKFVESPIGNLKLVASDQGLVAILWEQDNPRRVRLDGLVENAEQPILKQTEAELRKYFSGKRTEFTVPLDMRGTPFQNRFWRHCSASPMERLEPMAQLADQLGNPRATRAVGAANGRNPVAIIAPCHRVIGSSGKLTGFAGGLECESTSAEPGGPR